MPRQGFFATFQPKCSLISVRGPHLRLMLIILSDPFEALFFNISRYPLRA